MDYKSFFREMFAYIGRPLEAAHGMARDEIREHEQRLGIDAPAALVAYYEVAGRETTFNCCHDQLLAPEQWYFEGDRFIFYEENQAVVVYGIQRDRLTQPDPMVELGATPEPEVWVPMAPMTTKFLQLMTYWQGLYGGAIGTGQVAQVEPEVRERLDAEWEFVGELNRMWCYRRPGQIVSWIKWDGQWTIFAGGATDEECDKIARDLGVTWEPWS